MEDNKKTVKKSLPKDYAKDLDVRLATTEGQIRGIRQMAAENKPCDEILLQLYAIRCSLEKVSKKILTEYVNTCAKEIAEKGDIKTLQSLYDLMEKYI